MIAIIDYGMGNLRSVQKAFEIQGIDAVITRDKQKIKDASHVILPGVGAVKDALCNLEKYELVPLIKDQVKSGKPFLGICLGMQMMLSKSFENGEFECLDIFGGEVVPFKTVLNVPHIGWNDIKICKKDKIFEGLEGKENYVYFVHSYHAAGVAQENILTQTTYDYEFTSAVFKDNVYGFQFHPEKSGDTGLRILKNFGGIK